MVFAAAAAFLINKHYIRQHWNHVRFDKEKSFHIEIIKCVIVHWSIQSNKLSKFIASFHVCLFGALFFYIHFLQSMSVDHFMRTWRRRCVVVFVIPFFFFFFVLFLHINKMLAADKSNTHNVLVTFHSRCVREPPMMMTFVVFVATILWMCVQIHRLCFRQNKIFTWIRFIWYVFCCCCWIHLVLVLVLVCSFAFQHNTLKRVLIPAIFVALIWSPFFLYDKFIHSNSLECDSNG